MDHKKKKKTLFAVSGAVVIAAAGAGFFVSRGHLAHADAHATGAKHAEESASTEGEDEAVEIQAGGHAKADPYADAQAASRWRYASPLYWVRQTSQAFHSLQAKVDDLRKVDERARRLELENANLRLRVETLQLGCHAEFAERKTKNIESALTKDTGSKIGRTLASIAYKPPTHLFPEQLFALAVSYFKAHDDEKAAVILTYLTNLEQTDKFKTAQNLLMTGVAWYRVDNPEMADLYFGRTLETPAGGQNLKAHAHARLWRGLVAKREGNHDRSQKWLRDLLDHHPQSTEAEWVNHGETAHATTEAHPKTTEGKKRETASVHDSEE